MLESKILRICTLISGFTLLATLSVTSGAHHSNAPHFDNSIEIRETGSVTDWKFVNPHAFIYFDVTETDGSITSWRCETDAASGLARRGYSQTTFTIGETITVIGNPAKREDNHCFFRDFIFEDGTVVNRNTDVSKLERAISAPEKVIAALPEAILLGDEPDITGYWWDGQNISPSDTSPSGPPPGGGMMGMGISENGVLPPRLQAIADIKLTPAGQIVQDSYEQIYDDPALHCKISNVVDAMGRDESVNTVIQQGDKVLVQYGYMDYLRTIHMNQTSFPANIAPTRGGYSIGRWEGDTLVVDTIGFTPSIINAQIGGPLSSNLRLTERWTLDKATGEINRTSTFSDPTYWDQDSYTSRDTFRPSAEPYSPYNCQPLSGINNLRPGTPEYAAELAKMEAQKAISSTTNPDLSTGVTLGGSKLWIALLALIAIVAGLVIRNRKDS